MDIELLQKDDKKGKLSFVVKGIDHNIANSIRRNVIEHVPTMAIEDVEFVKNSSVFYDEIIAHRLGLIPLKTDLKSYNVKSKCKCNGEGCARCECELHLKAKGAQTVLSEGINSKDPKVKPVFNEMPICHLDKDQVLEFTAKAILGTGKEHTKFSPAHIFFKHKPLIAIEDGKLKDDDKKMIVDRCPMKVFELKGSKLQVVKDKEMDCHLCNECQDLQKGVTVTPTEDCFVFYVESFGQLNSKDIIEEAADILVEQCDSFAEELKNLK